MPRRPSPFKQAPATRALRTAIAATGLTPSACTITLPDGTAIKVEFGGAMLASETQDEFDAWRAKKNARPT